MLETVRTGLAEVILSPRTTLAGSTLRRLDFRERYGVHVLAILREGRALRSNLRDVPLRFGDALLLFGRHQKLQLVSTDPEFVVLTRTAEAVGSRRKAAVSALILLLALLPV
jgi:di/tricarboxylate transporter